MNRVITQDNRSLPETAGNQASERLGQERFEAASQVILSPFDESKPNTMRYRVALLTNIPAPYRLRMFQLIARRHDLQVFLDRQTEPNRSWKVPAQFEFAHHYLRSLQIPYMRHRFDSVPDEQRYLQISCDLLYRLRQFKPQVVVTAEMGLRTLQASLYCHSFKVPLILWWEGTPHTEGWVREHVGWIRRHLVGRANRFWSNGREAARLLQSYGARPEDIDTGMIGIDTQWFWSHTRRQPTEREKLRTDLHLSGTVFLFVGRFVKAKGIEQFLAALARLQEVTVAPFSVVFAGGGPEKPMLEKWSAAHPTIPVQLLEFQQSGSLADLYAAADVFVLPTLDDNWSLATLEAAIAGLPQVFSIYNGAVSDLLMKGAKGTLVDPFDRDVFAAVLSQFTEHGSDRINESAVQQLKDFFSAESLALRACRSIEAALL